ncbi:MAG: AraC family transcriptional regulator [Cyanobium sp.]|nr:AraC family transcriptional regulator [Cyanobium sp.]
MSHDGLFHPHLLPITDVVLGDLVDAAALPPLHRLSDGGLAEASSAFHLICQAVDVIALRGPAVRAALAGRRRLSLIYVESGDLDLLHPDRSCSCSAGGWVLVPGCSLIWDSTPFSVVCLLISPEKIALHLPLPSLDSPQQTPPLLPELPFVFPATLQGDHGVIIEMLTMLLRAASQLYASNLALLDRLEIGHQVCRLIAALVDPRVGVPSATDARPQVVSHGRENFDALIRFIKANLDQPLNLTVLATQSNYSRRTLQYAFRNWLGCTATQWIRSERLDLAWLLLQDADHGDTVTSIARSCGYRSLSLFSIEFQRRFHIKPSVLLRSARQRRTDPPRQEAEGLAAPGRTQPKHGAAAAGLSSTTLSGVPPPPPPPPRGGGC